MSSSNNIQESDAGYIPIKSAVKISKYSASYVARLCKSGKIKCIQVNKIWSVNEDSFEDFVSAKNKRSHVRSVDLSRKRGNEYYKAQKETEIFISAHTHTKSGIYYTKPITKQSFFTKVFFGVVSLTFVFTFSSASITEAVQNTASFTGVLMQNSSVGLNVLLSNSISSFNERVEKASDSIASARYKDVTKAYKYALPVRLSFKNNNLTQKITLSSIEKKNTYSYIFDDNIADTHLNRLNSRNTINTLLIEETNKKTQDDTYFKQNPMLVASVIGSYLNSTLSASPVVVGLYVQHMTKIILNTYTKMIYMIANSSL